MSPRPGSKSRTAGCFVAVFFSLFALMGALGIFGLLTGKADSDDNTVGALVILGIFFLVGLVGLIFGVKMFRAAGQAAAPGNPVAGSVSSSKVTRTSGAPSSTGPGRPQYKARTPLANGYYRMDPESSHKGQFWLWVFVSLFWNGITWVFAAQTFFGVGNGDAPPVWFISIFIVIGLLLIFAAVKSFFRMVMVGETHLDVNADVVVPGQTLEIMVSQPGNYKIDSFKIDFICRESATYRAGTDTHTKTEIVRDIPICDLSNLTARDGNVLACHSAIVPPDAMPSFEADNNKITWLIRVKMVLPGRPDVEQCFPILVVAPESDLREVRSNG